MILLRSKLKLRILKSLNIDGKLSPKMIANLLQKYMPSISRALIVMEKFGLVRCTTPEKDRWRFYAITKDGKEALKKAEKFTKS